jgi:hypothetical protein
MCERTIFAFDVLCNFPRMRELPKDSVAPELQLSEKFKWAASSRSGSPSILSRASPEAGSRRGGHF